MCEREESCVHEWLTDLTHTPEAFLCGHVQSSVPVLVKQANLVYELRVKVS